MLNHILGWQETPCWAQVIAQAQFKAKSAHVTIETHVRVGHAVRVIVDFIERECFDLLAGEAGYASGSKNTLKRNPLESIRGGVVRSGYHPI